jgi:alkanesulfonate monooxygenase SsuD/methylene tetrahydromethanopterin reductase-like flavin-dependent oxidoreductase (luciferase family)
MLPGTPLRIGVLILPEASWADMAPRWRRAEELGLDHAWTFDHVTWRSFRDAPWFSSIPTLTAAAMETDRIRLGTLVASPNFRHPVPFAKELVTLDDICAGRLTLGMGAGSVGWDATMLGEPWSAAERADRFSEFLSLLDLLLTQHVVSHEGRYYPVNEARTYPGCVQRPRLPFAVAGIGPRGMRLAATYGQIWVTNGTRTRPGPIDAIAGAEIVREQMARLDDACVEVGRDPSSLRRLVLTGPELDSGLVSAEAFRDTVGRYAEVGVTDFVVPWPRAEAPYAADVGVFEQVLSS